MPQRIAAKVPHDLVQVAVVERHLGLGIQLQPDDSPRYLLGLAELIGELVQEFADLEHLAMRAVTAVQLQDVLHHAVETLGVVVNDGEQPGYGIAHHRLFLQQFGGVADRRQRVPDFVRHVGGEPAECRELHLARLLLHPRQVLEKNHRADVAGAADRHETRAHFIVERDRAHLIASGHRTPEPFIELLGEPRRILPEVQLAPVRLSQ